jgi:hypothetical protein
MSWQSPFGWTVGIVVGCLALSALFRCCHTCVHGHLRAKSLACRRQFNSVFIIVHPCLHLLLSCSANKLLRATITSVWYGAEWCTQFQARPLTMQALV